MPYNTVTYKDKIYPPKVVLEITKLRHERWALYAAMNHTGDTSKMVQDISVLRQKDSRHRLAVINARLYHLTGNKIYNA